MAGQSPNMDQFEAYFQRADMDRDGRISGEEAVAFFQGANLPKPVLAQIWTYADQNRSGYLGRPQFYNALKLVTVAQSKRELTADIVKAALYGPASAKIPAPQINFAATPGPQSNIKAGGSSTQLSGNPVATQSIAATGPLGFPSQQTQLIRPPRPPVPSSGFQPHQGFASQGMPGVGAMNVPHRPSSSGWVGGSTVGSQTGFTPQDSNQSSSPSTTHGGFGPGMSSFSPITQSNPQNTTGLVQHTSSKPQNSVPLGNQIGVKDSKALSVTGNGFASDSVTSSQPKQNSTIPSSTASSIPASSSTALTSAGGQPSVNSSTPAQQPPYTQTQQFPSTLKANQHVSAQTSSTFPVASGNSISGQSQPPWPRMTQSDVQKYSKVFMQVDTDRDGKITGEQARNLFLSWRLPREVLKQVWDLSDQDNDSKLSLREFCIALYLMERYRDGHPLPTVFPSGVMFDETLLPASGQPNAAYGNTAWRPAGFQQAQGTRGARQATSVGVGKPPRPVSAPNRDDTMQPSQQKPKVPVLEKHLVDQLSTEEQDSLNTKFQEAKDAEKKVSELEKEIFDAKEKIQFYHSKMQELILYKSRCDNRLNEITERVSGDKREADSLAKKYEEKYKEIGDVASKLTIQEATFRDIQEKKMELYRAIVKLEQGNADGIQDRASQIQLDLEQLVKALNERCKTYGLRGKPTSLVELPFGWQPGVLQGAADWDEAWDKFEDEGFTFVKELTLEVQNVIAPPKPKSSLFREKSAALDDSGAVKSPSNADEKSEVVSARERTPEAEGTNTHNLEQTARSPPDSPAGSNAVKSPSKELQDPQTRKDINRNGSPHAFESQSEYGGAESVLSGDKGFDEPGWGSYDTHYDMDATWDFNPLSTKDSDDKRHSESSLFGSDNWDLPPIKTGSTPTDAMFPKQGPLFDSVPSTPITNFASSPHIDNMFPKQGPLFDSVPSTPISNFASSPHIDNIFQRRSPYAFADSVPSTPVLNSSNSPRSFGEGLEDHRSFDSFSRFDSFNMHDSSPFASRENFSRFDSMRSTRDSDFDQGYFAPQESLTRFDSFRSTADSEYGLFPPRDSLTRFDSMHSTRDSEYGHGFPSFDDAADPFGTNDPFKTSHDAQTPRRDSDSWKAF
ncbi:Calcium-binding EF hand family protein [Forsythia ovata]|uniref:Calcium-binding EF hand family protein n=1 Tax=Forsythia ovata TaxID=205694 RepID=A0ABD1UU42_9LAMI